MRESQKKKNKNIFQLVFRSNEIVKRKVHYYVVDSDFLPQPAHQDGPNYVRNTIKYILLWYKTNLVMCTWQF